MVRIYLGDHWSDVFLWLEIGLLIYSDLYVDITQDESLLEEVIRKANQTSSME